ncbi:hypothetical protein [Streptomyces sp. NPDC086838]|uniref:hypothetical protein n=1 Tax=Streptomyces sp. NPDC086838 TaxID=3365762 RepID=UPI000B878C5E
MTEPCWAKARGPSFQYYQHVRLITGFSFETSWRFLTRLSALESQSTPDNDAHPREVIAQPWA